MYDFTDIAPAVTTNYNLPSEAICYNGHWIDQEIAGFRTLYTSGRELASFDAMYDSSNFLDGAYYHGRRKPEREITVGYQIESRNVTEFRDSLNRLNRILRIQNAKIIFHDEEDKYFIGSMVSSSGDSLGLSYKGEFNILCPDPYKYSTREKVFYPKKRPDGSYSAQIDSEAGTDSILSYRVKNRFRNNLLKITDGKNILCFGNDETPNAQPPSTGVKSATQVATDIQAVYNSDDEFYEFAENTNKTYSFAYAAGRVFCFSPVFFTKYASDTGSVKLSFKTSGGLEIAEIEIQKKNARSFGGRVVYRIGNRERAIMHFSADPDKPEFPVDTNSMICFSQNDRTLQFWGFGEWREFDNSETGTVGETLLVEKLEVTFESSGDNVTAGFKELSWRTPVHNSTENTSFNAGDTIEIDGASGMIHVNGEEKPGLEVLGSEYFKASPGRTEIVIYDEPAPNSEPYDSSFEIRLRERWE